MAPGTGPSGVAAAPARAFLDALSIEIERDAPIAGPVRTLFLGGGTPSALAVGDLDDLFDLFARHLDLSRLIELSVEANPEDLSDERVDLLARRGVTRVSLGVQSFSTARLRWLGRRHRREHVEEGVARLRDAGIRDVSVDLILGVPGQRPPDIDRELEHVARMAPDHVSVYGLTYEPGTPLTAARDRGAVTPLDDDAELALLRRAVDALEGYGYRRYEVSNFARDGRRCAHNLVYWRHLPHLAFGPSAVRYVGGERARNHPSLAEWSRRLGAGEDPVVERERLDPAHATREAVMVGLRTRAGVREHRVRRLHGVGFEALDPTTLDRLVGHGLVERSSGHLRLTRRGFDLADGVAAELLAAGI